MRLWHQKNYLVKKQSLHNFEGFLTILLTHEKEKCIIFTYGEYMAID